ncbi:MAG: hypothetical protein IPJ14_00590 [Kineosporiaceae bacterium]|nr:hypothetical protein [Kineosporiaceae bacterium]MBK7621182.1 hypothetical protein [Kineosporiaceae bacterium]
MASPVERLTDFSSDNSRALSSHGFSTSVAGSAGGGDADGDGLRVTDPDGETEAGAAEAEVVEAPAAAATVRGAGGRTTVMTPPASTPEATAPANQNPIVRRLGPVEAPGEVDPPPEFTVRILPDAVGCVPLVGASRAAGAAARVSMNG